MAWGRVVRLVAQNRDMVQVDVSALRIDARCVRSRVFNDNEMEATIYNANSDTISKFLQRGTNIMLYAGYEQGGEPGLMWQGNIIDSKTLSNGTDTVTTIRSIALRSLKRPFTCTPVCLGFKPGATAADVIDSICAILGLVPYGKEMATEVSFPSGWTFVGNVINAMKKLAQDLETKGMGIYVDLAEMVVFRHRTDSSYSIAYLTPDSGLLNLENTTDYVGFARTSIDDMASKVGEKPKSGEVVLKPEDVDDVYAQLDKIFTNMKKTYSAKTMVIPKLRPNALVRINDERRGVHDGLFVVDKMEVSVVNLKLMGLGFDPIRSSASNLALPAKKYDLLVSQLDINHTIIVLELICIVVIALLYWFFGTEYGSSIRATGANLAMSRAQGINVDNRKIFGLVLSNGLVAFSGGLLAQYQGNADANMGKGAIVIGLAAICIGDALFSWLCRNNFALKLIAVVLGGIVYYIVYATVIYLGLDSNYLKMLSALLVAFFLAVPYWKKKYFSGKRLHHKIRKERGK